MTQINPVRDPRTYSIVGCAMEVHRVLGSGFLESVYQEALAKELRSRAIPFQREVNLPVTYKGEVLGAPCRADFLAFDSVIVELKAIANLTEANTGQVLHYLKASRRPTGLILNFGSPSLQFRRVVLSK